MRVGRWLILVLALAGAWLFVRPLVHGLSFVIRAAEMQGVARRIADLDARREHEREVVIPTARGPLRARIYEAQSPHRASLLTSGLHSSGIDEPRLVRLARQLSESGVTVVTPDIPELSRFEITPAITDAIERAGTWLALESALAPDHTVGLMGISSSRIRQASSASATTHRLFARLTITASPSFSSAPLSTWSRPHRSSR